MGNTMQIPAYAFGRRLPDTTIFGIRAQQDWADLALWERLLDDHPELKTVIEIGTFMGGLSAFLATQAGARRLHFQTWDIERKMEHTARFIVNGSAYLGDALSDERLRATLADPDCHPLLIFCDGGNKTAEFATFAPLLQPGDIIGVHDWGQEIGEEDVAPHLADFRPAGLERHLAADSLTRFYRKTQREGWGTIAIGIRIGKFPEVGFFESWTMLLTGGVRKGDTVLLPASHMPAHSAANELVRGFLRSDKDSLLMVDDDMTFGIKDLERLRDNRANWGYDMVCGLATHRSWPPKPIIMRTYPEQPGEPWARRGEFFKLQEDWEAGAVVPADAMGLAFTLIRRDMLEELTDKSVDLDLNFWFDYGIGRESDDISFCRRARKCGWKLAVDTTVELGHIAQMPLSADNWRAYQKAEGQGGGGAGGEDAGMQRRVQLEAGQLESILESYEGPEQERARAILETIRGEAPTSDPSPDIQGRGDG